MSDNLCPACGPVERETSSRYCATHLRALLGRCIDAPTCSPAAAMNTADPMDWLSPALVYSSAA